MGIFQKWMCLLGAQLQKSKKEGHVDHLLPSSHEGPNHISNRVLSCATCNEAEKLDGEWHEFILRKNKDLDLARVRITKIREWQQLNGEPNLDKDKLRQIERLSDSAAVFYEAKVNEARKLRFFCPAFRYHLFIELPTQHN